MAAVAVVVGARRRRARCRPPRRCRRARRRPRTCRRRGCGRGGRDAGAIGARARSSPRLAALGETRLVRDEREDEVVGDEEVEPAVAVVVGEAGGDAPPLARATPRCRGHVVEACRRRGCARARCGAEARHVEVDPAVVVEVARRRRPCRSRRADAALLGDVDEATRREPSAATRGRCGTGGRGADARRGGRAPSARHVVAQHRALHQVHVEVAVVVVVDRARRPRPSSRVGRGGPTCR